MWKLLTALLLLSACSQAEVTDPDAQYGLKFLTYNIRYGTANDGANSWPARRDLVAELIRSHNPDILALQEGLAFQIDELESVLAPYTQIGEHRDGGRKGEFSGLFIRQDRIKILDSGSFWLSPTPDEVGSRGWDAALPRTAAWADVETLNGESRFRVYGTHFDHRGAQARLESARLIRQHSPQGTPVVVMGDLNAEEDSPPLREFLDNGFRSAYSQMNPRSVRGTFSGFSDATGGRRIDHILYAGGMRPLTSEVRGQAVNGIWPSDHFAVSSRMQASFHLEKAVPVEASLH
jgi:endonuclease/exonuclease/phosphatase family metal-dependent hydrolase